MLRKLYNFILFAGLCHIQANWVMYSCHLRNIICIEYATFCQPIVISKHCADMFWCIRDDNGFSEHRPGCYTPYISHIIHFDPFAASNVVVYKCDIIQVIESIKHRSHTNAIRVYSYHMLI
jgi:hypothetical protein